MASLPSLVVSLALDSATFVSGLTKAEYQAKKSADAIKASIDSIGSTIEQVAALVGIGLGIDAFKDLIKGAIEAEAQLQLLGDRAGLTGSQLSSFLGVAARSRTDLETVVQASAKLSKALLDFGNEGAKSTLVLKALGVQAKDVPGLLAAPDQALLSISKTLDQLPTGGTKAAANLLILGRGGSQAAAFIHELSKELVLSQTRTQDQIDAAKELADRFIDLGVRTDTLKTTFANALIAPINGALDAFAKLTTGANSTQQALEQLVREGAIQEWARTGIIALATLVESLRDVGRVAVAVGSSFRVVAADLEVLNAKANAPSQKITGALGFTPEQAAAGEAAYVAALKRREDILRQANQNYKDLIEKDGADISKKFEEAFAKQDAAVAAAKLPKNISFADIQAGSAEVAKKAKDAADAAARVQNALDKEGKGLDKKILEGQLKALEDAFAQQRDLLKTQEEFLKGYYDQNLITLEDYYRSSQETRDEALKNEIAILDKEIEAQKAYKAQATKAADRQGAETAILALKDREIKLITDAVNAEKLLSLERTKAAQKYADELAGIQAQLAALNGSTAQATALTFDIQSRGQVQQATLNKDQGTLDAIAAIRQQAVVQAGLNDVTKIYDNLLGQIAVQQGYINLAQSTGRISEIEALQKQSDLNRAMIPFLQAEINAYEQLAAISKDPADILKLEQMRLELEKLKTQTDLLADTFNKTFGDAFASALSDVVTGAKSVKDAFNDMVKSITKSIADLAAKGVASSLFGQGGPLSGIGDALSKIFGGGGSAVNTGAAAASAAQAAEASAKALIAATTQTSAATALTLSSTGLDASAAALSAAAAALTSSAFSLSTGSIGSTVGGGLGGGGDLLSGIIGLIPGEAGGTDYSSGGLTLVGEHGPEIVNLPRGAQVIPNSVLESKRAQRDINITQHINVMPGASTQSARQAAAMVRDATLRSAKDR